MIGGGANGSEHVSIPDHAANFDIVVIVGSYGALPALLQIVRWLPQDFPAPIVVVQHATLPSYLPRIVAHHHPGLATRFATEGEALAPGTIYFASPGRHLLITADRTCRHHDGPKIGHSRPSGDPLFKSAAVAYGHRALGVVLSGYLADGTAGSLAIREVGGVVIAQEPHSGPASSMPQSVINAKAAHFILGPSQIGAALVSLVCVPGVPSVFGVGRRRVA